jgi:hypothetical protein
MKILLQRAGLALIAAMADGAAAQGAGGQAAAPEKVTVEYRNGFVLATADGAFSLRLASGLQFRYTNLQLDESVKGNETDYSAFFIRRARLWWDGHAFDPRFTYCFNLQLEPMSAVNLHDAWLQYKLSEGFAIGMGRNKIPYGAEFMASGFGLNFIDRSLMYAETDVSASAGSAGWPGGGTAFSLSAENPFTGFPTGGLCLFRSQGVSATGMARSATLGTFQYEAGVWQGRNTRGGGNVGDDHLFSLRLGYYPNGWLNWTAQGDPDDTARLLVGLLVSAYSDATLHTRDATGASVPQYRARDTGYNLSVLLRHRGLSVDLEWGTETYDLNRSIPGPTVFNRGGWRAAFGYFLRPGRLEIVARYAEVRRLEDPTAEAVANSGLGFVQVWDGTTFVEAIERALVETTLGVNVYVGQRKHQHKVFFDVSSLVREFVEHQGFTPRHQEDCRFRSMVQVKF